MGQRSQHSSSPPLMHTAQKSSFSMGAGVLFLAPGVRGMSLCSSEVLSTSSGRCPVRGVTVTFLPPRPGPWEASGRLFWLTLGKMLSLSSWSTVGKVVERAGDWKDGQTEHSLQGPLTPGPRTSQVPAQPCCISQISHSRGQD